MDIRFPLRDVKVKQVEVARKVNKPVFTNDYMQINQNEFALQVEGIANYYACNGNEVEYAISAGAEKASIELYLNGSVYGAILYQRRIMPLHGSCFNYKDQSVMICGDSGAGKSSLTASFWQDGARFLTDDVTPIIFRNDRAFIWNMSDRIKLWNDTLEQLGRKATDLKRVSPETDKYYYPIEKEQAALSSLDIVYIIDVQAHGDINIKEFKGPEKFGALRGEIYRPEYLLGMPENEKVFFDKLISICNKLRVFKVIRPEQVMVKDLMEILQEHLSHLHTND